MRKTLIIFSILLIFITLTYTLFSFETLANGTITDLTGTTWEFNEEIETYDLLGTYEIEATVYNAQHTSNIDAIFIDYGFVDLQLYGTNQNFFYEDEWKWYSGSGWGTSTVSPTIEINGGADATDTDFIEWLQDNATQMIDGYDVSFNSMGGSSVATITNVTGIFLTDEDGYYLSQYIPTKSGYKFDGWYTDTSYTNLIKEIFVITSDITLYAKWAPIFIYFDMNGGEGVGYWDGSDIGVYQYSGGTLSLIDAQGNYTQEFTPYKEGWLFQGWYSGGEFPTIVTSVNTDEDITLYARWGKEILVELNLNYVPSYRIPIGSIDKESVEYIAGTSSIVRYLIGDIGDEEITYITFYAVSAGAAEIYFNDNEGNEYSIVINVSQYGTTINYYKTLYIGDKYEITSGIANVDLSSMTYLGGDDTYCYVSSPYAGIPLNDDVTPQGDYIYFYGLKKGHCIINFNGKNDYPPVTFYFTILGVGEIYTTQSMGEIQTPLLPTEEQRGWDNLQKQLEDGFYENFINLDEFEIPGELNGFITNFNVWVNPLYTNGFVVAALTLVGIIAFAAYLVTAKTRG